MGNCLSICRQNSEAEKDAIQAPAIPEATTTSNPGPSVTVGTSHQTGQSLGVNLGTMKNYKDCTFVSPTAVQQTATEPPRQTTRTTAGASNQQSPQQSESESTSARHPQQPRSKFTSLPPPVTSAKVSRPFRVFLPKTIARADDTDEVFIDIRDIGDTPPRRGRYSDVGPELRGAPTVREVRTALEAKLRATQEIKLKRLIGHRKDDNAQLFSVHDDEDNQAGFSDAVGRWYDEDVESDFVGLNDADHFVLVPRWRNCVTVFPT